MNNHEESTVVIRESLIRSKQIRESARKKLIEQQELPENNPE